MLYVTRISRVFQAHHSPGGRTSGESGLRNRPLEFRYEQLVHESGARADRAVDQIG